MNRGNRKADEKRYTAQREKRYMIARREMSGRGIKYVAEALRDPPTDPVI
jgi:hypothetical protein